MAFLHGVETIEIQIGPRSIKVIKSAVIALLGTAPKGAINEMKLILGTKDAAQFGSELPGFTIPQSLDAIFKQGPATVIVVNVFDQVANTATVTNEEQTVTAAKLKLDFPPIADLVITNSAGDETYVLNTDYKIDDFGNVQVISFANISEGDVLKSTYKKIDEATITANQLIGSIDGTTGIYTGIKMFQQAKTVFGFSPKVIIAPGYTTLTGIATEMEVLADKVRGQFIVDAPAATTFAQALAGRGPAASFENWNTGNPRAVLTYPRLMKYNPYTETNTAWWLSAFWAGVKSATDLDASKGFHYSPSNIEIVGAEGLETNLSSSLTDVNAETNLLNEAGIVTCFNGSGTGILMWGNRNASFPSSGKTDSFISVRATADIIEESIEQASLPFIDKPINKAIIDTIQETVNSFLKTMVQKGAIIDGTCRYDEEENTIIKLAAGHITFTYDFHPPLPIERLTYKAQLNLNLLANIAA